MNKDAVLIFNSGIKFLSIANELLIEELNEDCAQMLTEVSVIHN